MTNRDLRHAPGRHGERAPSKQTSLLSAARLHLHGDEVSLGQADLVVVVLVVVIVVVVPSVVIIVGNDAAGENGEFRPTPTVTSSQHRKGHFLKMSLSIYRLLNINA